MKGISKRIHSAVVAALFLGSSIAVLILVTHMTDKQGKALGERLQLIADDQVFEQQYVTLATTIRDTEEERQLLQQFILEDERDTIDLLSMLDTVAKKQGVELTTRNLQEQDASGPFNKLLISYEIQGHEEAVIRMVEMLEVLPYHGHTTSFSLQRKIDGETGLPAASANISLELSIRKHD